MSSSETTTSNPVFHDTAAYYIHFNGRPHAQQFKYEVAMKLLDMGIIKFYETRYIGGAVLYFKVNLDEQVSSDLT